MAVSRLCCPRFLRAGAIVRIAVKVTCEHASSVYPDCNHNTERADFMSAHTDINTLIVESPEIRGGRPRLAGTGVTVRRVVGWYKLGLTPEDIAERIGHVSVGQVFAALAYYHVNRDEIDSDLAMEESAIELLGSESTASHSE